MKLTQFVTKTQDLVNSLKEGENWCQAVGTYGPRACCIGAHLAGFFGVARIQVGTRASALDFTHGARAACEFIGCTREQLDAMLQAAGAPASPFSGFAWPIHPSIVWQNLAQIEDLPPANPNLHGRWIEFHRRRFFETQAELFHAIQEVNP